MKDDMAPLQLLIILGSSRAERHIDKVLNWIQPTLSEDTRFTPTVFDPASDGFPMPMHPDHQAARDALARQIGAADAFLIVAPEYNRGYTAALKDVIDSAYVEWARKPVAFASYGGVSGGLRAVEQLRPVMAEVHATTLRDSLSLANPWEWLASGQAPDEVRLRKTLRLVLDQLHWWGSALRSARQADTACAEVARSTAPAFTLINTFPARKGQGDALLALQIEETRRLSSAAHSAGWRGNRIYRAYDDDSVTIVTSFDSEEAKLRWQRSDAFKHHLELLEKLTALDAVDSRQLHLVASHGRID